MEAEDEDLWAPFLAYRPGDRRAERLRAHAKEDAKRGQRHPPRRATGLSRDEIVRAAIEVADAEAPEPSGDWRKDLHAIARTTRASLHRHPWAVNFMGGRPPTGPKTLRNLERSLGSLDGLGLDKVTAISSLMTVGTYVLGAVLREIQEANGERYMADQFAGMSDAEKQAVLAEFAERVRQSGRYPHMVAMMNEGIDPDAADTRDERFEFGLDCLLDGLALRISAGQATEVD